MKIKSSLGMLEGSMTGRNEKCLSRWLGPRRQIGLSYRDEYTGDVIKGGENFGCW